MNIASRGTVDRKLKELVADKFLEVRKNPKNKMDKTNHYRVDLNFLRQELKKLGYTLEGYAIPENEQEQESEESPSQRIAQNEQSEETLIPPIAQNEQSNAQNEQSITHCEQTIPEITSEISNQQITSKESIIQEEIKNLELPSLTKRVLLNKIDRLILLTLSC
ncbi:hypothetical protein [Peribacillus asahii]|uniref:hypothetical protein n=1 Tax=Peribacillus asahii TaxID=228899 RepID=UPI0020799B14|nr:hypothetical protein [Peribacillus asahii]USK72645.1 hypothetical protein LIS76_23250 [Peribacillus asahii]